VRYLSIKNHKAHQHYKNRRPPWIKLHVAILDDYAFTCLQDASKAHLLLLGVLASKMDNRIPYDLTFLSQKLGITSPIDVELLVEQGFVEVSEDDSKPLASRKRLHVVETEGEVEVEAEKEKKPSAPKSGAAKGGGWFAPFNAVWEARFGGPLPVGPSLPPLGRLRKAHGHEETLRRWTIYVAHNEAKYANAARLESTFGEWANPPTRTAGTKQSPAEQMAASLRTTFTPIDS
jgi:hypothetical protein